MVSRLPDKEGQRVVWCSSLDPLPFPANVVVILLCTA